MHIQMMPIAAISGYSHDSERTWDEEFENELQTWLKFHAPQPTNIPQRPVRRGRPKRKRADSIPRPSPSSIDITPRATIKDPEEDLTPSPRLTMRRYFGQHEERR